MVQYMLVYSIRIMKLQSIKREQCCGSCWLWTRGRSTAVHCSIRKKK